MEKELQDVEADVEKGSPSSPPSEHSQSLPPNGHRERRNGTFAKWNRKIESMAGFEARGLERVPLEERQPLTVMGLMQMHFLWLGANLTIKDTSIAMTCNVVYGRGFVDSAWCAVVGVFLGSLTTADMSTWGSVSGNRTMVMNRFFFGFYPSKICTPLNIVLMVGYGMIDCIIGGQVLSAVSGGSMSIAVGVVIVALIECIIAGFGLKLFHIYERFAWLPQLLVLSILIGVAGPHFNVSLKSSVTGSALNASKFSYLTLCFYVPNSWAAAASDYYDYYPPNTPKWKIFLLTMSGLYLSFWLVNLLGVGLGCGVAALPKWSKAYNVSSGALIVQALGPLGGFGKFCSVIIALGVIANCVPSIYSAAICCQIMGRWGEMLSRWVWVICLVAIELVCGVAGRNQLFTIFQNFVALMGYWVMPMICILAEEHFLFKRGLGLDWSAWVDRSKLPVGCAALVAFLLGWVGAVLGMSEVWFVGPLSTASGGADIGMWVGTGLTLISFPVLRWWEVKKFGR